MPQKLCVHLVVCSVKEEKRQVSEFSLPMYNTRGHTCSVPPTPFSELGGDPPYSRVFQADFCDSLAICDNPHLSPLLSDLCRAFALKTSPSFLNSV